MNNEMTTDNMSNEEVIKVLKGIVFNGFDRTTPKERQALDLAIKALEERPQGETNAEIFQQTFGIYATELWSMSERNFLEWLNMEVTNDK